MGASSTWEGHREGARQGGHSSGACDGCAGCWPASGGCGGCARWRRAPSAHWAPAPVAPAGCSGWCGPTRCRCLLTSSPRPSGPSPSSGRCRYGWSHCFCCLLGTGRDGWGMLKSLWKKPGARLWSPLHLTFAVLTAGAAPAVAVPQLREAWVRVVGVRGWRVLVRESHGPRGRPRVRQRGQCVLVRGSAGAIVVVEGQVGHVCGGQERAGCWDSPIFPHPLPRCQKRGPSLGWVGAFEMTATAVVVSHQNGRRHRPEISCSFRLPPPSSRNGREGAPTETAPGKLFSGRPPVTTPEL